ncbi:MAG: energy transducer TonB [Flavobacteriia bacterium]|nr:energy transducer TonB [Flavobacteriia bacterium]
MMSRIFLTLLAALLFSFAAVAQEVSPQPQDPPVSIQSVESYPIAPGCADGETLDEQYACLTRFLQNHIREKFEFPERARAQQQGGRVWIGFVIELDGSISNVRVDRSSGVASIDAEALRVVQLLPKMEKPATLNGEPVKIQYHVPVNAQLH